jgi:hypothetical protein
MRTRSDVVVGIGQFATEEPPMAEYIMNLRTWPGAAYGEKNSERLAQRNVAATGFGRPISARRDRCAESIVD